MLTEENPNEGPTIGSPPGLPTYARNYRFAKTFCMTFVYLCSGAYVGLISPTMLDMQDLYRCNYEEYARSLMMKAIGIFYGSIIGGVISDRYRKRMDLFIAFSIFTGGAANAAMPWLGNLIVLGGVYVIQGLCMGVWSVVCSSTCISMWGERAPLPIHAIHVAYMIGMTVSPLIAQPFLQERGQNGTNVSGSLPSPHVLTQPWGLQVFQNSPNRTTGENNKIFVPYLITGSAGCVFAVTFFIFACLPVPGGLRLDTGGKSFKTMLSPASVAGGRMCYGVFMVICAFWVYVSNTIINYSINAYLFAASVDGRLSFTKRQGALLNTVFFISGALGRGLIGVIAHFLHIKIVLHVNLILEVTAMAGLAFFGLTSQTLLWVLSCTATFLSSPINPSVMAWTDRYIEVTGFIVCVIDFGVGVGVFVSQWLSGVLFQRFGPQHVFYLTFSAACCLWLFLIMQQIVCSYHGDRYHAKDADGKKDKLDNDITDKDKIDETSPLIN